ncbi:MAG: hypothetical protein BGO49_14745 [Planctomycetales bacterium 71-10]|nr:MAG: hypothetical protein BGO49_14745 [Planctomycetales bacterium 71-10]
MSRISWIVAAVAGLGLPAASAQELAATPCPCGGASASGPIAGGTVVDGTVVGSPVAGAVGGAVVGATAPAGPVHAYSYYVEFPAPARTYVPYGPTDTFTFQGQAYGHAYDRWTWSAMSGASPGLGRYYQLLH